MRIIPVIDVMGGVVVRAAGGRRDEYQPLVNHAIGSCEPRVVAEWLLDRAAGGWSGGELYIADLDSIQTGSPTLENDLIMTLNSMSVCIWLDAGLRLIDSCHTYPQSSLLRMVAGSETLARDPEKWPQDHIFSLDLLNGTVRSSRISDQKPDPIGMVDRVVQSGCRTVIALDVASVGERRGPSTVDLCHRLRERHPDIELVSGGGIRDDTDVRLFEDAGCDAVLVSTAIHDGSLFGL